MISRLFFICSLIQTSPRALSIGGSGYIANMRLLWGASFVMLAAIGLMNSHKRSNLLDNGFILVNK